MPSRIPVQLRFSDIDSLGHVNNTVYFSLMDLAKTRYFLDVMGHDLDISKAGLVVVNVNCSFCAPSFFGEELEVITSTAAIGEKSLTLEQAVICPAKGGEVKCTCRTVMCGFDPRTSTSIPISDEWRQALERYENCKF
ncbi:MAG: acyl-CoA thioesterase [Muribaculaceae bacterium]|nr:acyl-CoA thioesterase [Muribaculaceae bacterium]